MNSRITNHKSPIPLADLRPYCWAADETFNARKIWVDMKTHVGREWAEALFEQRECYFKANKALKSHDDVLAARWEREARAWGWWLAACSRTWYQLDQLILTGRRIDFRYY